MHWSTVMLWLSVWPSKSEMQRPSKLVINYDPVAALVVDSPRVLVNQFTTKKLLKKKKKKWKKIIKKKIIEIIIFLFFQKSRNNELPGPVPGGPFATLFQPGCRLVVPQQRYKAKLYRHPNGVLRWRPSEEVPGDSNRAHVSSGREWGWQLN